MAFWRPGAVAPGADVEIDCDEVTLGAEQVNHSSEGWTDLVIPSQGGVGHALPVDVQRERILFEMERVSTVLICGDTSSGKTTRIPQFLIQAGWTGKRTRKVIVTEPRRLAAISAARRVAEELKSSTLRHPCRVGYAVRLESGRFDSGARDEEQNQDGDVDLLFTTDGTLLRLMMKDPLLLDTSVVMVDEAHERSLSTDLLLGLLRKVQVRRGGDLRIMLSSATLDVSPMVDFFGGKDRVAVVDVRGRSYPVEILYCKEAPVEDFLKAAENAVRSIHRRSLELEKDLNSHGILVFVTSPEDVLDLVASLSFDALELGIQPLALFASLPMKDQQKALEFSSKNLRKVVVATNVAESSLTVPGISYVIDCGLQKSKVFNPNGSLNSLCIVPISKATAKQRAGRAGRIGPGICFRLYSEQFTQESMAQSTPPEILRCELTTALLQLKALGIENILKFPFPTKPRAESIAHALDVLHSIGALDSDGRLTEDVGSHLIELPLSPQTGRCLVEAWHLGCEQEVAAIFAMLECGGFRVFRTGASQQWKALEKSIAPFAVAEGDLLSLLNVYQAYQDSGRSSEWCKNRGIFARPMDQAFEIRLRLLRALPKKYECGAVKGDLVEKLLRCIISGFHAQIVAVLPDGTYRAVTTAERGIGGPRNSRVLNDRRFAPHPGSVLYNRFPSLMVYCNSLERPGSEYIHMQNVTAVPAKMVADLVPDFYRISRG